MPKLTDVEVVVSGCTVTVVAFGEPCAQVPRPQQWTPGARCTLAVTGPPTDPLADPAAHIAAACEIGHAFFGDVPVVTCDQS